MNKLDFEIFFEQIFPKSEMSPVAKMRHGIYIRGPDLTQKLDLCIFNQNQMHLNELLP